MGCPSEAPMCLDGKCIVPTCTHVEQLGLCHSSAVDGVRARQFCPVTCGCQAPMSSLALHTAENGCPESCMEITSGPAWRKREEQHTHLAGTCTHAYTMRTTPCALHHAPYTMRNGYGHLHKHAWPDRCPCITHGACDTLAQATAPTFRPPKVTSASTWTR